MDGLRARFRRGSHRLGDDPQRQWSMTHAPVRSTGRSYDDSRQRERNPLHPLRNHMPGWHAT
ncbi:hypothetical protein BJF78_26695 [Pseudonocardia sp. CNS-139]|nr:hypothetical protein BJF78_26695 [Pseudonocardia sp. CNS-139]